jgi:hypothetical protein
VDGTIFNSKGIQVGFTRGPAIFDPKGNKLYGLKGVNIYKLSGELVGHLNDARGPGNRLDKLVDKLFPQMATSWTRRPSEDVGLKGKSN